MDCYSDLADRKLDTDVRSHFDGKHKKTGQICWREKSSVSDLELSGLAGFFAFIWPICARATFQRS